MTIKDAWNKSTGELVDELGLAECIYQGYIDHESDLDDIEYMELVDNENSYYEARGQFFDDYEWVCKIFSV